MTFDGWYLLAMEALGVIAGLALEVIVIQRAADRRLRDDLALFDLLTRRRPDYSRGWTDFSFGYAGEDEIARG